MHSEYILRLIWVISPLDQSEISSSSFKDSQSFEYDPQNHFHNKSVSKWQMDPGKRVSRKNGLNLVGVVQPCCASCTREPASLGMEWVCRSGRLLGDGIPSSFFLSFLSFFSLFLPFLSPVTLQNSISTGRKKVDKTMLAKKQKKSLLIATRLIPNSWPRYDET